MDFHRRVWAVSSFSIQKNKTKFLWESMLAAVLLEINLLLITSNSLTNLIKIYLNFFQPEVQLATAPSISLLSPRPEIRVRPRSVASTMDNIVRIVFFLIFFSFFSSRDSFRTMCLLLLACRLNCGETSSIFFINASWTFYRNNWINFFNFCNNFIKFSFSSVHWCIRSLLPSNIFIWGRIDL